MSDSDPLYLDDDSSWQLLTEFLIPSTQVMETQVVDHVADILRQFGLESGQLGRILAAISQSLHNLEGNSTPYHLRISVSGLEKMLPKDSPDHLQDLERAGRGLGFFLVKRIVGQLHKQESDRYRLLEVLIYRE